MPCVADPSFAPRGGGEREVGTIDRDLWHPFSPPTRQVRHDVAAEVKLRFGQDDPASGPAASSMKRRPKLSAQAGRGNRMSGRRPRKSVEHTEQDLPGDMRRQRQKVFQRGVALRWLHLVTLAHLAAASKSQSIRAERDRPASQPCRPTSICASTTLRNRSRTFFGGHLGKPDALSTATIAWRARLSDAASWSSKARS